MNLDDLLKEYHERSAKLHEITKLIVQQDWRHLANRGERVMAMQALRYEKERQNETVGPKEALEHIDSFIKMLNNEEKKDV